MRERLRCNWVFAPLSMRTSANIWEATKAAEEIYAGVAKDEIEILAAEFADGAGNPIRRIRVSPHCSVTRKSLRWQTQPIETT